MAPISFDPSHREMGNLYAYSKSVSTGSAAAIQQVAFGRISRPSSIIQGERLEISRASRSPRSDASSARRPPYASAKVRSSKVTLSISTQSSQGASDARSDLSVGVPCSLPPPVSESEDDSPRTINSDVWRDTYSPSEHSEITDNTPSSMGTRRNTFDLDLKSRVLEVAQNFSASSKLLINLRGTKVGRCKLPN